MTEERSPSPESLENPSPLEENPDFDPLLESLKFIAQWHGIRVNQDQVLSGLPLIEGKLTPGLLVRAAERLGFKVRVVKRKLRQLSSGSLPAILILEGNRSGILQAEERGEGSFREVTSKTDRGLKSLSAKELSEQYAGYAILLRPIQYEEPPVSVIDALEEGRRHPGWFWSTVWKFRGELFRLLPVSILINLFALAMPIYIMSVYDRVVPNDAEETLWVLATGALIVFTFEYLMRLLRGFLLNRTSKRLDGVLASGLFDHLMAMEMGSRPMQSSLLASKARSYEALRDFFTSATLVALVDVPFAMLMIGVIFYFGGWAGWIPLMATVVALTFGLLMQVPLRRAVTAAYRRGIERQSFITETVAGMETIKGGNAQNSFQRKMENMIREASEREIRSHWYSLLGTSTTTWLIHLTTIFVVIACVFRVYSGEMTLGGVVACVLLTSRAMTPLAMVTGLMTRFQQMLSALRGLNQVMALPREYGGGKKFTSREDFRPSIQVKDVLFHYPGQSVPALDHVSLDIEPGQRIGLIGSVGSGKSTLLKILAKFYEPEEGEIVVDGLELPQYHPIMLRRHVGYLPQNPAIFHGSLRDNVALGAPWVKDEDVMDALRFAGLESFVNHNSLGIHLPVGENGGCLSGGQRAGVALARCLLQKPKLLLLDEPTASMDRRTEGVIIKNLREYLSENSERTLILSTHKLHLLELVDHLILLEEGKAVKSGPRDTVIDELKIKNEPSRRVTARKVKPS